MARIYVSSFPPTSFIIYNDVILRQGLEIGISPGDCSFKKEPWVLSRKLICKALERCSYTISPCRTKDSPTWGARGQYVYPLCLVTSNIFLSLPPPWGSKLSPAVIGPYPVDSPTMNSTSTDDVQVAILSACSSGNLPILQQLFRKLRSRDSQDNSSHLEIQSSKDSRDGSNCFPPRSSLDNPGLDNASPKSQLPNNVITFSTVPLPVAVQTLLIWFNTFDSSCFINGVEYAAELFDLFHQDLQKLYLDLISHVKVMIYDVALKILPNFRETPRRE